MYDPAHRGNKAGDLENCFNFQYYDFSQCYLITHKVVRNACWFHLLRAEQHNEMEI